MVKDYLSLNSNEKDLVYAFLSKNPKYRKSLDEIEKEMKGEIYGYGEGALFYIEKEKVLGKACVILEVAEVMKDVYIHSIDILGRIEEKEIIFKELLSKAIEVANRYNAEKVLLGIRDEEILGVAGKLGYNSGYAAYNMILGDNEKRCETKFIIN